jgi:hypothetical protein
MLDTSIACSTGTPWTACSYETRGSSAWTRRCSMRSHTLHHSSTTAHGSSMDGLFRRLVACAQTARAKGSTMTMYLNDGEFICHLTFHHLRHAINHRTPRYRPSDNACCSTPHHHDQTPPDPPHQIRLAAEARPRTHVANWVGAQQQQRCPSCPPSAAPTRPPGLSHARADPVSCWRSWHSCRDSCC